jgi:hypothetical protein
MQKLITSFYLKLFKVVNTIQYFLSDLCYLSVNRFYGFLSVKFWAIDFVSRFVRSFGCTPALTGPQLASDTRKPFSSPTERSVSFPNPFCIVLAGGVLATASLFAPRVGSGWGGGVRRQFLRGAMALRAGDG